MGTVQTRGIADQIGARSPRSPRRRVVVKGRFDTLTGASPVAVCNLSSTGAQISCANSLKVGGEGVLQAPELDQFCRIVWAEGERYGLEFDERLDPAVVLKLHGVTRETIEREELEAAKDWYHSDNWD